LNEVLKFFKFKTTLDTKINIKNPIFISLLFMAVGRNEKKKIKKNK
jgi:hypothetical protein